MTVADKTPTEGQEAPTLHDKVQSLTDSLDKLGQFVESKSNTPPPAPEPAATQTDTQAIEAEVSEARRKAPPATVDKTEHDKVVAELQAKLERYESEQKAQASQRFERKSEFSLADARESIAETTGMGKAETKHMFGALGAQKAQNSQAFGERFGGGRTPLDVIMRGAFEATRPMPGQPWSNFKPFSVGSDDEVVRNAQDLSDAMFFWRMFKTAKLGGIEPNYATCPFYGEWREAMDWLGKALDTTDTTNWVPTGFSSALIERYDLDRNVVRQLNTFQMPRSPFDLPVMGARTTSYLIAENTADPESATAVTTSDMTDLVTTLSLVSIGARTSWSYELDDDSMIPIATAARDEMARSLAFTEEQAILDGDTAGTHMDSDVTSATDARKAWLGLRAHAIDQSYTRDASAMTDAVFSNMIRDMGNYGARSSDLFWIVPPTVRAQLLVMKDASGNPMMIGAATSQARPSAQTASDVPMLFGLPVVVSEAFRTNLTTAGIYDGTTTTDTGVLLVNRQGFVYAFINQAPITDSQRWIRTRQFEVVTSIRREFEDVYAIASNQTLNYGISITT
jgi:HK97 family phage major capsid protein